ncbi:MAG: 16S rRNA (adenine(1518)-N(6)/adenine(1519)-N(6))-dimethyltransferase RsmA [Acidobacteria bacterium]|nr:16S rRNA (adenine(1518)-N(6)/adenine(1519)-N(6))-dimethyltransferase RsmA [Acidobacteriota bacterium]
MKRPPLGQHFLNRASILDRIAAAACPQFESLVVEIGPGQGSLTTHLLERAQRLVAIEVDAALAGKLRSRFAGRPHFEVVHADVLDVDLSQWGPAVVAGNLPYYITSPILDRVLEMGPDLVRAVLLMQKEVAARLSAQPGSRDYGFLTVRTAFRARASTLFRVPAASFSPPPKVESAVVQLDPRAPDEDLPVRDAARFLDFVGLCFRQKRKTIRNNLAGAFPRQAVEACPEGGLRAEQLTLDQFADLYHRLTA